VRPLAAKFGVSRHCLRAWITKHRWTKAVEPRSYEGDDGQQLFQRDVRAAIKRAFEGA
jgi:uncharacterized protein YjcR